MMLDTCGVRWMRYEGIGPNGEHIVLAYRDFSTPDWVVVIDGVVRGHFTGPDSLINAQEAIPQLYE